MINDITMLSRYSSNVATISYRKISEIEPLETNVCDAMCESIENINRILVKATQAMCPSQNKRVRRSKGREENERSRVNVVSKSKR